MAITKTKLNQLESSTTIGSIISTNTSNVQTYVAPLAQNHLWGYEHGTTQSLPVIIGTNLTYDAGTNTLNASAGAGGYSDIQEEGAGFTNSGTNTKLNFVGSGITASDGGGGVTNITINSFLNTLATAGVVGLAGSDVSGTLPVGKGGTGTTTLTGLLQGNGTGAFTAITNSSTVGQVLRVTGVSTYAWGALDLADTDAITGDLPFANLAQGSALSVLGVAGNATADNASIAAATDNQVLRRSGTTLAFGAINLASSNAVTGVLPIANGGTGSATQNFVDLTNNQSIGGTKTFTSNITISATPSAPTDAATVGFVTTAIAGIRKGSVRVATTTNGTLATAFANGQVVDTVTLVTGDLILLKNQTAQAENGVYTVNASGAPTRATWMDTAAEIDGVYVAVEDGSTNAGTLWITVSEVTTLGTDAIVFTQIQTSGSIGGSVVANKVAYGSGVNTLTTTTNFHFNGTQLAIGTATPVTSSVLTTQGTGTTNTTFGYQHNNSSATQVFRVADNGTTIIGTGSTLTLTGSAINANGDLTVNVPSTNNITFVSGNGGIFSFGGGFTWGQTTGNFWASETGTAFGPSSGTATFAQFSVRPTINQTGGANGITRSIYVDPSITAAADHRGLEIDVAAAHYALFTTTGKIRYDFGTPAVGDILTRDTGGEEVRIAAGTAGHVLTSNGAGTKPTYQAVAAPTTVTRAYLTGSTASVIDLDSGTAVTDIDGANVTFTTSGISQDKIFVVRNGILLSQTGTVSRDYTLVPATGILTLASALTTDESLMVYKIV